MNTSDVAGLDTGALIQAWRDRKSPFKFGNYMGDYVAYELFDKLVEVISSKDVALVCTGSSMTSRIRQAMGLLNAHMWSDAPLPCNFRPSQDGWSIEFDFPEKYELPDGGTLHFDTLMACVIEAAAGVDSDLCKRAVRRMQKTRLLGVLWNTSRGSFVMTFGLSNKLDTDHEWLEFTLVNKLDIEAFMENNGNKDKHETEHYEDEEDNSEKDNGEDAGQ